MNKTKIDHKTPLACIVLAAGQGTRMKSALPKVMHKLAGKPMIQHVVGACQDSGADHIIPVIAPSMDEVRTATEPHACVIQQQPLGTGDAVKAAREALIDFTGHILILFGDTPLITSQALQCLINKQQESNASIVVGSFIPEDAAAYGRLILATDGTLEAIVEKADATPEQEQIKLCNGGIMLFESETLWELLGALKNDNAKNEYYLTDCIALGRQKGKKIMVAELDSKDILGINDRSQLAQAEKEMQKRLRKAAMEAGVTMQDPDSVYLCEDTKFGQDVTIEPNVIFAENVTIGDKVQIRAFSHIEGATIESGASIGPFARLRPGAKIKQNARIGNFVEIKNATMGEGAKAGHLSYIGDAIVGEGTNIGAGTITCNYDGFNKSLTDIGAGVFIGSNTALVAPVKVGDKAMIAAGSTITKDIPADALALSRATQQNKDGLASRLRKKQEAKERNYGSPIDPTE